MFTDRFILSLKKNITLFVGLGIVYVLLVILAVTTDSKVRKPIIVDMVFVFDVTGSMQDKIDGLLEISGEFAQKMSDSHIDYRIGMVSFGALGEPELIRDVFPLKSNVGDFQIYLENTHAYGGALGHEDQPSAIKYAMSQMDYRPNADKFIVLLTDEEVLGGAITLFPDEEVIEDWNNLIRDLKNQEFSVYSVTIPIRPYLEIAKETGGRVFDIRRETDFTDIFLDIVDEINLVIIR